MNDGIFNSRSLHFGDGPSLQDLRSQRLRLLGYESGQTTVLATTAVDIDQLERLIGSGCPHDLAVRIVL